MNVAILTDTNSGIDEMEAGSLGVHVIPMPVIIEGEIYFEGRNLSEAKLCDELLSGTRVSTSQPAIGDVIATWDRLLKEGYDEIVYIL